MTQRCPARLITAHSTFAPGRAGFMSVMNIKPKIKLSVSVDAQHRPSAGASSRIDFYIKARTAAALTPFKDSLEHLVQLVCSRVTPVLGPSAALHPGSRQVQVRYPWSTDVAKTLVLDGSTTSQCLSL